MLRTAGSLSLHAEKEVSNPRRLPHPIIIGLLASLSNPYWTLWWATIGLGYLVAAMKFGLWGVIAFFFGHVTADFSWYSIISLGVSRGKSLLKDKTYQIMIRVCALFLLGFGAWFLLSAKGYLTGVIF